MDTDTNERIPGPARDAGPPEAQAMLALLRKAAQAGEWDLDLESGTSRRSLRHDQCFGYASAIPGERWGIDEFLRHVHPDDRVRVGAGLRHAMQARHDWSSEFRVVWPDGSVHWLHAAGSIVRNGNGRATRMLGIVLDLTEQRRAERALTETEQLARGQLDALRGALEVLAAESAPEQLMEHAMRTITEKWGAHSSSLWLRDEAADLIGFELAFEHDALVRKSDARFRGMDLRLPMEDLWPWPQVFEEGRPALVEDIRTLHSFGLRDRLLPLGIITVLLIPMSIAGRLEGAIGLRFTRLQAFSAAELELAQALANQAMLALQLSRVSEQGRDAAVIAERMRMARDIHDTVAQGFTGVIVQLEAAEEAVAQGYTAAAGEHIVRARALARASLQATRRSVGAMRDQALLGNPLGEALRQLVAAMTDGTPVTARFAWTGAVRPLPAHWEDNLLHVAREALTNVLRHAAARHADAVLAFEEGQVSLVIQDDGRGFDPACPGAGFGLRGIRERAAAIGGGVDIESRPGAGTRVRVVIRTDGEAA